MRMIMAVVDYEEAVRNTIEKMEGRDLYEWHIRQVVEYNYALPDFAREKVISMCKEKLGIKP